MSKFKGRGLFIGALVCASFIGFQNCSKANFQTDAGASLRAASTTATVPSFTGGNDGTYTPPSSSSPSSSTPSTGTPSDSNPQPSVVGGPSDSNPNSNANQPPTAGGPSSSAPSSNSGTVGDAPDSSQTTADLVECDMGTPSYKVILEGGLLSDHSNASSTRICMSETACLSIINAYAAARNCTLASGAATTPSATGQCTEIFPGSKGTCHNAQVLTDGDVANLLLTLAQ